MKTTINRLRPECVACVAKKYMYLHPENLEEEVKIAYMQKVLEIISQAKLTDSAPVIVRKINDAHEAMFGYRNDFRAIKPYYNDLMLNWVKDLYPKLEDAQDALKMAIQFAMIGNYIDFGGSNQVNEEDLAHMFEHVEDYHVDEDTYNALRQDLKNAKRIVLLTDNCGEVVLDKMLLETIEKLYPQIEIKVIVRGEPVLNDVTIEDAVQVGLTKNYEVLGNGNSTAGTVWEELSDEAQSTLLSADVILSKGQANFETLRGCGLNVYYIFLCKCEMFANFFNVKRYSGMLINDDQCALV